ncbi:MAG: DUF1553 domain-containing protein, partial [Planctomycetota bacterium]
MVRPIRVFGWHLSPIPVSPRPVVVGFPPTLRVIEPMKRFGLLVVVSFAVVTGLACTRAAFARAPIEPFETTSAHVPVSPIDRLVTARLKELGIEPAPLCSDAVFVRRVYLDLLGMLPTAEEAKQFIDDPAPDKRAKLIDALLKRPEFVDYRALKWGDLLRIKSEFPIKLWPNAVQAYSQWVHAALEDNVSYDYFVRRLLTASGSNFREPPVNFYRAVQSREPKAIAQAVALTFMGVRPEAWTDEQWEAMSVFFSCIEYKSTDEWKEEIVSFDIEKSLEPEIAARLKAARFPDGTKATIPPGTDPRTVFADWLIRPENPWFARNIVNRVWYRLMGRGIIHEPDDIRDDNPPSNPALLAYLEKRFVESGYDLVELYREILNSRTYQQSSIPASGEADPTAEANFAYYITRRLDAEVLIDAICQITGTSEEYVSPIPEPFTYIPEDLRTVQLFDGSITSAYLEMFGRPPRDTGLESERKNKPTASQRLYLLNSTHIQRKLTTGPKIRELLAASKDPRDRL